MRVVLVLFKLKCLFTKSKLERNNAAANASTQFRVNNWFKARGDVSQLHMAFQWLLAIRLICHPNMRQTVKFIRRIFICHAFRIVVGRNGIILLFACARISDASSVNCDRYLRSQSRGTWNLWISSWFSPLPFACKDHLCPSSSKTIECQVKKGQLIRVPSTTTHTHTHTRDGCATTQPQQWLTKWTTNIWWPTTPIDPTTTTTTKSAKEIIIFRKFEHLAYHRMIFHGDWEIKRILLGEMAYEPSLCAVVSRLSHVARLWGSFWRFVLWQPQP